MPTKTKTRTAKRGATPAKAARKKGSPQTQALALSDASSNAATKARFVQDVLVRGDAAERTKDGGVPQHATHAIKRKSDGSVDVERVRFKAF
jgi:hypothetical protein